MIISAADFVSKKVSGTSVEGLDADLFRNLLQTTEEALQRLLKDETPAASVSFHVDADILNATVFGKFNTYMTSLGYTLSLDKVAETLTIAW